MPTDIAPDTTHSEEDGQSHCSLSSSVPREPTRPSRGERVWGLIRVSVRVTRLLLAVYVLVWLHERRLWEMNFRKSTGSTSHHRFTVAARCPRD